MDGNLIRRRFFYMLPSQIIFYKRNTSIQDILHIKNVIWDQFLIYSKLKRNNAIYWWEYQTLLVLPYQFDVIIDSLERGRDLCQIQHFTDYHSLAHKHSFLIYKRKFALNSFSHFFRIYLEHIYIKNSL